MKIRLLLVVCASAIAVVILAGDGGVAFVGLASVAAYAALFAVVVSAVLRFLGPRGDGSQNILRERLARGEITQAEFADAQGILGH